MVHLRTGFDIYMYIVFMSDTCTNCDNLKFYLKNKWSVYCLFRIMDPSNKCGYCDFTSETLNTLILHYKMNHPLGTIQILIPKQNESGELMGYHVMNSAITPATIGNRDVTFSDDLVLREAIQIHTRWYRWRIA